MITKVVHGWRVGGLIAYLMGPGRAQEHVRPRVIASWDGRDARWQPRSNGSSPHDLELGPLIRAVRAPAVAAKLPEGDSSGKRGYVWHLSVRLAAADRVLTDTEWAGVVRELLDGAGVAVSGDAGGPRWVAIRHADDHVHVAVVLVRQDTGRRFWPSRDYPKLREATRGVEARLGLTLTAAADGTAAPAPSRGEREKAARAGRAPARVELARLVRAAAVAADGLDEFVEALEAAGCVVAVRRAPSGDPIGYAVARAGDLNASGLPVSYSGSKLAADLSMPRLMTRWSGGDTSAVSPAAAQRRAEQARKAVAAARRDVGSDEDADGIALAAADVLTAMRGWSPEMDAAGEMFDRAARAPRGSRSTPGPAAASLRGVARALIRQRHATRSAQDPAAGGVALVVAIAALLREIAGWQKYRGRDHQAVASTAAADRVAEWATSELGAMADGTDHTADHHSARARPRPDRSLRRRWRASRN